MDVNNYREGTSAENQALHLMLIMHLIITTPLSWKRTLNLFKIQYFFQMIVFLPSYIISTLIIWLPHKWLDFNDSLLYLFKSRVISTAIKKAWFSSEVIKFPIQGTVCGCYWSRLSRIKMRFPPFYQRIGSSFSLGPGDTFIYFNVLAVSVFWSEPRDLTGSIRTKLETFPLCVLHGAGWTEEKYSFILKSLLMSKVF